MKLFFCSTPLHLLITREIIKTENLVENYLLVYFYKEENRLTNEYYLSKMPKSLCMIKIKSSRLYLYDVFSLLLASLKLNKYISSNTIFCAGNMKMFAPRLLARLLRIERFCAFDDGVGSLINKVYFHHKSERKLVKLFFILILGSKYLYENVLNNLSSYYTYVKYNGFMHRYCENIIRLDIFQDQKMSIWPYEGNIVLLLLPSYADEGHEINHNEELEIVEEIAGRYGVKYVVPHPMNTMENYKDLNCILIKDERIAEEIVISMLHQNNVNLIGFRTSTFISLSSMNLDSFKGDLRLINIDIWKNRYNIDLRNYNEDLYKDNSHETVYYEYKA